MNYLLDTTPNTLFGALTSSILPAISLDSFSRINWKDYEKNTVFSFLKNDSGFEAKLKLPGFEKNEISVILGQKSSDFLGREIKVCAKNSEFGTVSHSTWLPTDADESSITANLKNGILKISAKLDLKKIKQKNIEITEN